MTQSFSVNANNDMYLGPDGNLAISRDLAALVEICSQVAKTVLGELVLATNVGIPYFQTVFNGAPTIPQFEAAIRSAILAVAGVTSVLSFTTTTSANTLNYTINITTIYGPGVITNG